MPDRSYGKVGNMRTALPRDTDWMPAAGYWWRFNQYEIVSGVIRPTRDARLEEYDPWKQYLKTRTRGGETLPAYAEFVNLRNSLSRGIPEAEAAVLDWCSRYGLPGMLPHQIRSITLAPRWRSASEDGEIIVPSQRHYVRTHHGWAGRDADVRPTKVEYSFNRPELKGLPVPRDVAPDAWEQTCVLRQPLRSPEHIRESLRETWWEYFPAVPQDEAETYDYPIPLSEDFWRLYAEPYGEFLHGVQYLGEALWSLRHHQPVDVSAVEDARIVKRGVFLLETLLAPATVTAVPMADGTFAQAWICGSLLSAFALMALQDLTESRRVRDCAAEPCGRLFVSQHPAALYCSDACRWKMQKRASRRRVAERSATAPSTNTSPEESQ